MAAGRARSILRHQEVSFGLVKGPGGAVSESASGWWCGLVALNSEFDIAVKSRTHAGLTEPACVLDFSFVHVLVGKPVSALAGQCAD
jgi:hypothetical protein